MKIAVDAMGGDNAPQAIVEGVMLAKQDFPDIEFQLYGKEAEIKKYITDEKNITIFIPMKKLLVTMSQLKQSVVRKLLPWF